MRICCPFNAAGAAAGFINDVRAASCGTMRLSCFMAAKSSFMLLDFVSCSQSASHGVRCDGCGRKKARIWAAGLSSSGEHGASVTCTRCNWQVRETADTASASSKEAALSQGIIWTNSQDTMRGHEYVMDFYIFCTMRPEFH